MKKLYLSLLLIIVLGFIGCKSNNKDKSDSTAVASTELMSLNSPNIPVVFTTPEDRGGYLVEHYWDNLNLSDTTITYNKDMLEQKWVDYIDLLPRFAQNNAVDLLREFYCSIQQNNILYPIFTDLADKYLYSKDSPFQNDAYLVPILEVMLSKDGLDTIDAQHIQFKLDIASKNNPGLLAQDFAYTKLNGSVARLSQLKKEYTLVFLFNPECNFCLRDAKKLGQSLIIERLIKSKRLDLLAICVEQSVDSWKDYVKNWPQYWIHGYDTNQVITTDNLYDLRAIPSFYLLDKDKKVILKDRPIEEVIDMLSSL